MYSIIVQDLTNIYSPINTNNFLADIPHPYNIDQDNNDNEVLLLIRLMDNDPALEHYTSQNQNSPMHKQRSSKSRKLEKLYNHITNTIKATETRIKLQLPPSYVKLKISIPPILTNSLPLIRRHCIDFFHANNVAYLAVLNNKLLNIQTTLLSINKNRDPSISRQNLNYKEWLQISKFEPSKTPLMLINENIDALKSSISFEQPKYNTENLSHIFNNTKRDLLEFLKRVPYTEENTKPRNISLNDKLFTIYNPSDYIQLILPTNINYTHLPKYVTSTLNKGLNFTPHTDNYPINSLQEEFKTFKYKILWQNFFAQKPANKSKYIQPPVKLSKNRLKHTPPANHQLNLFSSNIENTITSAIKNLPKNKPSLDTILFYRTKLFFKSNPQYIVKPADKGSTIVIMHRDFYLNLGLDFFNKNESSYRLLEENPLSKYTQKITSILNQLNIKKMINNKLLQLIKPANIPKTPNLYFLPKIHKLPNLSGRPICSGNSHPAENISLYLDYVLKPYATTDPIYLKDGPQLLQMIENIKGIPDYAIIFSLDVVNMYPSIPLENLISTIDKILSVNPSLIKLNKFPTSSSTIITLLKTVLYTNYSHFNNKYYKQTHGVAMGTPCACTITDIFMCNFVKENFFNWTYQPRLYKQYRDDSFGLWLHGENTLLQYLNYINTLHPTIKFTLAYGKEIQFLDLKLSLTHWGSIETETFYKPTDTFQYLDAESCHPPAIIKNIPKSQFLRHTRNCSSLNSFLKHAAILRFNLRKRSYPKTLIKNKLMAISKQKRTLILKTNNKQELKRTPLILTYNSNLPNIQNLINSNLPKQLQNNPPLLAYRIKRSVGSYIIKAKFQENQ